VLNVSNIPAVTEIKPDYRIYGQVKVIEEGKYKGDEF
jgi:hypothetical protein